MSYKINPDLVAKLYKGGKITERTARLHGYAEGGVVTPNPNMAQVPVAPAPVAAQPVMDPLDNPALPQDWFSKLERGVMTTAGTLAAPFTSLGAGAEGQRAVRERVAQSQLASMTPEQKAMVQPPQPQASSAMQPQLVDMPLNARPELEIPPGQEPEPRFQMPSMGGSDAETAARQAVVAGQIEGIKTAEAMSAAQDTIKNFNRVEEQKKQEDAMALQEKEKEIKSLMDEYAAIKPNRQAVTEQFWDSKSTSQKVLAGIGMIFGAFSTDGVNRAVQMIEKQIDKDLELQINKQKAVGERVGQARNLYNDLVKKLGDDRSARIAMKQGALEELKLQIETYAKRTTNANDQVKAQAALLDVQNKMQENRQKLGERLSEQLALRSADPVYKQIAAKVPDQLRTKAMEEAGKLTQLEADKKFVSNALRKLSNYQSLGGRLMSPKEASQAKDQARAELIPVLARVTKMKRDELETIVESGLPSFTDSDTVKARRIQSLMGIIENAAGGETPILNAYGIRRPKVDLGERVK